MSLLDDVYFGRGDEILKRPPEELKAKAILERKYYTVKSRKLELKSSPNSKCSVEKSSDCLSSATQRHPMSFRASPRSCLPTGRRGGRVEKSLDSARDRSVFEWISPLRDTPRRFGRNDGRSFLQSKFKTKFVSFLLTTYGEKGSLLDVDGQNRLW